VQISKLTPPQPNSTVPDHASKSRDTILPGLVFLLTIGIAEYVYSRAFPVYAVIIHILLLFTLIVWGARTRDQSRRQFWLVLGIVPIIRIVSIAMPVMLQFSQFIWYIIIAIPIFVCVVYLIQFFNYSLSDVGLTWNYPVFQVLVGISGIGLAIIDYSILKPESLINSLSIQIIIFPAVVLMIFTAFLDELVFRGVVQKASAGVVSTGWVLIAGIYAATQISYGSILHCLFSFLVALYFGWIVKRTGSIAGVTLCHGLINCGVYLILPHIFNQ
jgi:uncharacterized protein